MKSRRKNSSSKEMKGGAWFKYPGTDDRNFNFDECHQNKLGGKSARFKRDKQIIKHILDTDDSVDFNKLVNKNTNLFNTYKKTLTKIPDKKGAHWVSLRSDKTPIYIDRKVFHKYYGEGKVIAFKSYPSGYGYYIRFIELPGYVYTFASDRMQRWFWNTILVETYPNESLLEMFLTTYHIGETNGFENSACENFVKYMRKCIKKIDMHKYNEINEHSEAWGRFCDINYKGKPSQSEKKDMFEGLVDSSETSNEDYMVKCGKSFLGLPDEFFTSKDELDLKKRYLKILDAEKVTFSFPDNEEEATQKAHIATSNDTIRSSLINMWKRYHPTIEDNSSQHFDPTLQYLEDKRTIQIRNTYAIAGGLMGVCFLVVGAFHFFPVQTLLAIAAISMFDEMITTYSQYGGDSRRIKSHIKKRNRGKTRRKKSRKNKSRKKSRKN